MVTHQEALKRLADVAQGYREEGQDAQGDGHHRRGAVVAPAVATAVGIVGGVGVVAGPVQGHHLARGPPEHEDDPEGVAAKQVVTHVLGNAEGHTAGERETWWEEKREEGLEDEEIAEIEESMTVPLFDKE